MKRLVFALMLVMGVVALPTSASAQLDLSKIGGLFGTRSQQPVAKVSPYKTLAENAPLKSEIVGTWRYSNLDLEYLGTNTFADAALSQVECVACEELRMAGVTPGSFTITLGKSGKGSIAYGDYAYNGSYTYDSSNARFELSATADNGAAIKCGGFIKKVNGNLVVMLDAKDALGAFKTILPELATMGDGSTFEMIYGVVQSFPGIYISMHYTK